MEYMLGSGEKNPTPSDGEGVNCLGIGAGLGTIAGGGILLKFNVRYG